MKPIKNRNLFRLTRLVLLKLPFLLRLFAKLTSPQKKLLVIKADAIGDYVMFRNFLEVLRKSEKYKDYQIDLVGNAAWSELALAYDKQFINQFYFIKPNDLYESPFQALKIGWRLFKNNYSVVLNPTYTRNLIVDGLAGLTGAIETYGFEGDNESIYPKYKKITDQFYKIKLPLPKELYFEFYRTKYFFENLLNESVNLNAPVIPTTGDNRKGIVIFPGAGTIKRSWGASNFLALIKMVRQHTTEPLYLAGGPDEVEAGMIIMENLPPGAITNLINQTTLPGLVDLISKSKLIISNETSAIHMAAATATKAICIMGGGHFGRFTPYPDNFLNKPVCVFHYMECYNCNWYCKFDIGENETYPCVARVSFDSVWAATQQLIPF